MVNRMEADDFFKVKVGIPLVKPNPRSRLKENYERAEGVCLPRCVLYTHYLDLCKKRVFTPAGAATFGKIIRQMFPKLTTRRLGTRGQSKYHYYGIGIKKTSIYYHSMYSGKGLSRFSEAKVKTEGSARKFSLSSKSGTLLPDFPNAGNLVIPGDISPDKAETFLLMYQTHCQRILDTIVSSNFEEVQNFLLHFWQGMPKHMLFLLSSDVIIDVIALCDSVLYKVVTEVLIPSTIQDIPEGLSLDICTFAKKLPVWLDSSLDQMCKELRTRKMKVVSSFVRSLHRQISFVQLAQTARSVLLSQETVSQMTRDLAALDLNGNVAQADMGQSANDTAKAMLQEFEGLLAKQAPLEAYIEWTDSLIDRYVLQNNRETDPADRSASFMLKWSFFTSKIMRDLTLQSAPSFGSLHLIHMMLTEYAFLVVESQQDEHHHAEIVNHVQKSMKQTDNIYVLDKLRDLATKLAQHYINLFTEEICTKATVRSSIQRSSLGSAAAKAKKRRSSNQEEESPAEDSYTQNMYGPVDGNQNIDGDCTGSSTQQRARNREGASIEGDEFGETCGAAVSDQAGLSYSSSSFRAYYSQRDPQPAAESVPSLVDDQFHTSYHPSPYATAPCDLYPVRVSGHAHPSYRPLHHHYHHRHLHHPLTYASFSPTVDDSGHAPGYAPGYELTAALSEHLPGHGHSAHSQMDIPDAYGCYMNCRAGETATDAYRHSHPRFDSTYNDFLGHQTHQHGTTPWFNTTAPGYPGTEEPQSRQRTYQSPEEVLISSPTNPDFVGGGSGSSRFMEIVPGAGRDHPGACDQAAGYYTSRFASGDIHNRAHPSRINHCSDPYR